MRGLASRVLLASVLVLTAAAAAQAQAITGTVRDDTGAVMPGVTVEVSSPALIEKVRAASTDATGQYRIVNLSPGTYTVTFTLVGFSTVKREGIELTGDFTATVNADLKVGALEETITVSGASPMVDIVSVTKQTVLTREQLDLLPTARNIQAAGVLIPGVESARLDVGGNTKLQQPGLSFRGTGATVTRWDGFWLGNVQGSSTGGSTSFYVNDAGAQELVYSSGADSIDMGTPGLYVNLIPKDGGNTFRGVLYGDFSYEPWSWLNVTDKLRARGLTNVPVVQHVSDFNPGFGGPIMRDKLWFYGAYRYEALSQTVVDSYYDKNPSPYLYEPDLDRPGVDNGKIPNQTARLTWQASSRDKVQFWFTNQNKYRSHYNISASRTPDATSLQNTPYAQATVAKWTRTQSSKLLFEAGYASGRTLYQELYQPNVSPSSDRETVQAVKIYSITDQANGKVFGAYDAGYSGHGGHMQAVRLAGNYVTGSHALLAGVSVGWATSPRPEWWTGDITMTFNAGVPQSVTLRIPKDAVDGYFPDLGIFLQDRWSIKRATITGGIRYDQFVGRVEDGTLPPSRWNPSQFFPGFRVQNWKDISPRLGVAYDLFGDGRTAIKANISRYVAAESVATAAANNPQDTIGRTDTRNWNDLNGDYTIYNPDGSLQANELGPTTNNNFGKVIPSNTTRDAATLNGFNARGSTVEWQVVMQHQLSPVIAVNGGYYFRWNGNQTATDNTLITNGDFDGPFCINAPSHPDLPNGGGYPVCGLYDIKPQSRSLQQNNVTFARNFGDGIIDHIQGFDLGATMRLSNRTFINAGVDANRRLLDSCDAPATTLGGTAYQVDNPQAQFCHQITPYRPNAKIQASHTIPGDVVLSVTYQNAQGPQITARWAAPASIITPALGRAQAAGATATKTVELMEPGKFYGDRMNQFDLRASKRIQLGRYRLRGDINLYNAFNSDFTPTVNTTFSTSASSQFLRPLTVLQGRLLKIGGQIEF
jgi:hypothetical protein